MSFDHRSAAGNEELIKRLFNKVYTAILSEKIFCPPETTVYLAAYACQAKFGPAISIRNPVPPVKELLPKSTLDNHNLSFEEWEDRISKWHLKLRDTTSQDAIVEYLDIAQDVELYGASIFEVETQSHARKWISLDAVGLNIYDSKRKPPARRYIWSEISSLVATDNKIEIELTHEPKQIIQFNVPNQQLGKLIERLFNGSKELYLRRKKTDVPSNYLHRSESNSSLRMRPHKLSAIELMHIEQLITELELELPRRATDYEYAAWQVKDQLRQARGIETKLSLNQPTTEETRQLQYRVAQIRVFLEQDIFNEKAIRIGGTLASRSDGYSSDIDSEAGTKRVSAWASRMKSSGNNDNGIIASSKNDNVKSALPQSINQKPLSSFATPSPNSSPTYTEDHGYIEPPLIENGKSPVGSPLPTMPPLPEPLLPKNARPLKPPISNNPPKPAPYDLDAYPRLPEGSLNMLASDDKSLSTSMPVHGSPGYPLGHVKFEMDRPNSVNSPQTWKQVLRSNDQGSAKGRLSAQLIEAEDIPMSNRPPTHPKPKVAPRGTADPRIITPDYYADTPITGGIGTDPKFSSLKVIQSGYTKKRVDLFEAL